MPVSHSELARRRWEGDGDLLVPLERQRCVLAADPLIEPAGLPSRNITTPFSRVQERLQHGLRGDQLFFIPSRNERLWLDPRIGEDVVPLLRNRLQTRCLFPLLADLGQGHFINLADPGTAARQLNRRLRIRENADLHSILVHNMVFVSVSDRFHQMTGGQIVDPVDQQLFHWMTSPRPPPGGSQIVAPSGSTTRSSKT